MSTDRNEQIARLFAEQGPRLERVVRRNVGGASDADIADACMVAWAALLTHEDTDPAHPRVFAWLAITAIREGWRIVARQTDKPTFDPHAVADVLGRDPELEDLIEDRDALAAIEALPELERQVMKLRYAGLTMEEQATALGWTKTKVNRYTYRALNRLRAQRGR